MQIRKNRVIYAVLFLLIVLISIISLAPKYDKVYCTYKDIDVNSGRIRVTKYILFIKVRQNILETEMSKKVKELNIDKDEPIWKNDTIKDTIFLYKKYPIGKWHGAIYACESFCKFIPLNEYPESKQRELLKICLKHLKEGEMYKIDQIIEDYKKF